MNPTLRRSDTTTGEMVLDLPESIPLADLVRATGLARALGARESRSPLRFFMLPSTARRWRLLFEGGWEARRSSGGEWRFSRGDRLLPLYRALEATRKEALCTG